MYEIFAKLLKKHNVTRYQVSKATGVPQSSLSDWSRGKSKPKYDNMKKIAEYFGVTVDYLLGNEQEKSPSPTEGNGLSEKENRDIAKKVENLMNELAESGDLMFDGNPMTKEAQESLQNALTLGYELARQKNKEKYTPKKYRK